MRTYIASSLHISSGPGIKSISYSERDARIEVVFHDGDIYHYYDVSEHEYIGLVTASSIGS